MDGYSTRKQCRIWTEQEILERSVSHTIERNGLGIEGVLGIEEGDEEVAQHKGCDDGLDNAVDEAQQHGEGVRRHLELVCE